MTARANAGASWRTPASRGQGLPEVSALIRVCGKPGCIVSDKGTEFTRRAIPKWADPNEVPWHDMDPGKPRQIGFTSSFNGSLRDALLNEEIFDSLDDAGREPALRRQYGPPAFVPAQPDAAASAQDGEAEYPTPACRNSLAIRDPQRAGQVMRLNLRSPVG